MSDPPIIYLLFGYFSLWEFHLDSQRLGFMLQQTTGTQNYIIH